MRMRIEQKDVADPLVELNRRFKGGGPLRPYEPPDDIVQKLHDLTVWVTVAYTRV
jgi:hypothetical protein